MLAAAARLLSLAALTVAPLACVARVSVGHHSESEGAYASPTSHSAPASESGALEPIVCDSADPASVSADAWRGRRERYVSRKATGTTRALGRATEPFAKYLVALHNRLHPVFTDGYVARQRMLSPQVPGDTRFARVELTIDAKGELVDIGIVRSSGMPAFDAAVLQVFVCLAPFDPPPEAIRSSDGRVYLEWELFPDSAYACSPAGATPYRLDFSAAGARQ